MAVAKRLGTQKFGWCMTGHCKKCPKTLSNGQECACPCHKEK